MFPAKVMSQVLYHASSYHRGCVSVGMLNETRTERITHSVPLNEELREVDDGIMFGVGASM